MTTELVAGGVNRPDYESNEYRVQSKRWRFMKHIKEGIEALRRHADEYLPRFESESIKDWNARILMTFSNNYYAPTLVDHVGLVFAEDPVLEGDVPAKIEPLLEDVDGERSHWTVFARNALDAGMDDGHGAIWTDMPSVAPGKRLTLADAARQKSRPYWTLIRGDELLSFDTVRIGGVEVLTQFVRKECVTVKDGAYGKKEVDQYLVVRQEVAVDGNGNAVGLGAITWERLRRGDEANANTFSSVGVGEIKGPAEIPLRIFYAGEKIGTLHSKPFLYDLAWTSLEETQIRSDYAAISHKCNVPTPVFSGLLPSQVVNMSQGINLPIDGRAEYLEPKGIALAEDRARLADVQTQLRRLGAAMPSADQTQARLTATEAAQVARQRNARLVKAARSLQDALEGALDDMAAFMGLQVSGGSVLINKDFAGTPADPAYVSACGDAFDRGAITIEEYRHVLAYGELPETTDEVATKKILDAMQAAKNAADAKASADARTALMTPAPPADKAA